MIELILIILTCNLLENYSPFLPIPAIFLVKILFDLPYNLKLNYNEFVVGFSF